MLNLEKLYKRPKVFRRLTGLTPVKFKELFLDIEPLFKEAEFERKNRFNRKRKIGGGNQYKLSVEQALFMLLLYYRTYTNHVFIGMVMNIDDSNVCRYFRRIEPLLAKTFRIPKRKIDISEEEILELTVDATEQETERRKGSGYSGKKKRNTVKTQIIVTSKGKIKSISRSIKGNIHDKKLYDKTKIIIPRKVKLKGDLGYVGTACITPIIKRTRGAKLTVKEKEYNKQFNRKRAIVEHTFAHLKKFKILDVKFRNKITRYNLIFRNIAGIRNFAIA